MRNILNSNSFSLCLGNACCCCLKKNQNAPRPSGECLLLLLMLLLLFLTFSVLVANPKKTTLHGGQSRSWSVEQGKENKIKVWQHTPPPTPHTARSEKINKIKSRDASTGTTQVLVGLASVLWSSLTPSRFLTAVVSLEGDQARLG